MLKPGLCIFGGTKEIYIFFCLCKNTEKYTFLQCGHILRDEKVNRKNTDSNVTVNGRVPYAVGCISRAAAEIETSKITTSK